VKYLGKFPLRKQGMIVEDNIEQSCKEVV